MIAAREPRSAPYVVTPEDELWLLRAVQAEGPNYEMVARALVNLFALGRSLGSTRTLADLVRAYAQPVNPKWAAQGTQAQVARRAAAAARVVFSPEVTRAVERALTTSWDQDVTDYAAPGLDASAKGYVRRSEDVRGVNTLWARRPGWRGYDVAQGGIMTLVERIRVASRALPEDEQRQVERALSALVRVSGIARVGPAQQDEWDLSAANTLEALYDAVADRVKELAQRGGTAATEAVQAVAKPATGLLLALALVLLLVYARKG